MSDGAFKRSCILGGINENAPVKGRSRPVGREERKPVIVWRLNSIGQA